MAEVKPTVTTIQVTTETRDRLAKLGNKDDSFEDIIKRLLDQLNGKALK